MPAARINMGCGPPTHAISHVPCQSNAALLLLGTPYTTAQSDQVITRPHTFVILVVFYLYFVVTFTNMNFEFKEEIYERAFKKKKKNVSNSYLPREICDYGNLLQKIKIQ